MTRLNLSARTLQDYERAADEYCRSLPLEHFMEATSQATQRKITLESLDLVKSRRPEVWVFNELLIQYERGRGKKLGQVVPDNMMVLSETPIKVEGSFDLVLQPAGPFLVLEYVSRNNRRKDYLESFGKYERELKVPYCLFFRPEAQKLDLYHHDSEKYCLVAPNRHGRLPIPELDLEVGLLNGWVRFWYQGKLLPLRAELQHDLDKVKEDLEEARKRADLERQRAEKAERELEKLRAQVEERKKRNGKKP